MAAKECRFLTTQEKDDLIALGWTLHGGPYDTRAECESDCLGLDTGTSPGTGTSAHPCCPNGVLDNLYATLAIDTPSSNCDCLEGTYLLTYDPLNDRWWGGGAVCGSDFQIVLKCREGGSTANDFELTVQCGFDAILASKSPDSADCGATLNDINLVFSGPLPITICCDPTGENSNVTVTITG